MQLFIKQLSYQFSFSSFTFQMLHAYTSAQDMVKICVQQVHNLDLNRGQRSIRWDLLPRPPAGILPLWSESSVHTVRSYHTAGINVKYDYHIQAYKVNFNTRSFFSNQLTRYFTLLWSTCVGLEYHINPDCEDCIQKGLEIDFWMLRY